MGELTGTAAVIDFRATGILRSTTVSAISLVCAQWQNVESVSVVGLVAMTHLKAARSLSLVSAPLGHARSSASTPKKDGGYLFTPAYNASSCPVGIVMEPTDVVLAAVSPEQITMGRFGQPQDQAKMG